MTKPIVIEIAADLQPVVRDDFADDLAPQAAPAADRPTSRHFRSPGIGE